MFLFVFFFFLGAGATLFFPLASVFGFLVAVGWVMDGGKRLLGFALAMTYALGGAFVLDLAAQGAKVWGVKMGVGAFVITLLLSGLAARFVRR